MKNFIRAAIIAAGISFPVFAGDSTPVTTVKITNGAEDGKMAGVELINGKNRLLTSAITIIEALFGRDNQSTVWFYIGTADDAGGVGAAGDTVRTEIPSAVSPIGTVFPACDVTSTVTAGHVAAANPELEFAKTIVIDFNADSDCKIPWKAERIKDFSGVFISARIFNEWGDRASWTLTSTGTTVVTQAFTDIVRRGFETELSRSPNNPRSGILAIAGSVTTIPGQISDQFQEKFLNGGSSDLLVNGSSTPVAFRIEADATMIKEITSIKCYGGGNGVKFGQYLSKSGGVLTNGVSVSLKSEDKVFTFLPIQTTEDWKNLFASQPGTDFRLDIQSGKDEFIARFDAQQPIPIFPTTEFTTPDYVEVLIQDSLLSGIATHECLAEGFLREL